MEKDELQEYLNALGRSDCYRVDAVLKDSVIERTERVFFVGSNGSEFGPFIRKIISNESGQGRVYEKLFRAQQAGKRFAHLPRIYECYSTDSSLVVVIEFIQGETLQQRVQNANEANTSAANMMSLIETSRVFPALCDAVNELHEAFDPPIIHRDLTPANIIVSEGNVTLIDLGIARTFHPDAQRDTTYFGTRDYAPPEQFGFGQTDIRSDVYAMGKVLQFCLIGGGDSGSQSHIGADQPVPGRLTDLSFPPQVTPEMAAVITRATQLDPAQRFQSVADLKVAFLSALPTIEPVQPSQQNHLSRQAPPVDSTPARGLLAFADRIPRSLGIVWDVFVMLFWLLIFAAANAVIIEPTAEATLYPTWFLVVEYYGLIVLPCTIIAYFLLDLRMLRDRFPSLKLPTRRKAFPFAVLTILALVVAVVVIANYAGLVPPSTQQ